MLRSFLIYLSKAEWARNIVTRWRFAWRAASRFIAGEKLEDAIRVVRAFNTRGINATLDYLGEHTTNQQEAEKSAVEIQRILEAIDESGVRSNVSIKLTQIGLALGTEICEQNLRCILDTARQHGTFVRIDMEDSSYTDATLALFKKMQQECGCENVGVVIQSYLYRSATDVAELMKTASRIRLCKGAYNEPPEIAFPKKKDVDENFDRLVDLLVKGSLAAGTPQISANGKIPPIPAIASHDDKRIEYVKQVMQKNGLPKQAVEFQMLNGIRRDLQDKLAAEGYPVRIYVPFGTQWYPYFVRRLAERPANVWFFLANFFRK